jgi:hypothetical protein
MKALSAMGVNGSNVGKTPFNLDTQTNSGNAEAAAKGPAYTDGNTIYPSDSFSRYPDQEASTLVGEGMHLKNLGTADGTIGDAAFAKALGVTYPAPTSQQIQDLGAQKAEDDAASPYFHKAIDDHCKKKTK